MSMIHAALLTAAMMSQPAPPATSGRGQQADQPATGMAWFRQADKNDDGFITFDEFPNRQMFEAFDKDSDNRLSMEELERAIADRAREGRVPGQIAGVEARRDIPYASIEGVDPRLLSLDLYLPTAEPAHPAKRPIIAFVHGGGWRIGDKSRVQSKPAHFTSSGYVLASINYRLSPDVRHPAHARDVASAIAWLRAHAGDFGGDPNRIILMGHSAGAHLVALVATDPKLLAEHGMKPSDLLGVIPLDTASFDIERRANAPAIRQMIRDAFGTDPATQRDASPIAHLQEGGSYPPFLVVYSGERLDAKGESERFAEALRAAGGSADLVRAEGKDHAAVNRDVGVAGDPMSEAIDRFIASVVDRGAFNPR